MDFRQDLKSEFLKVVETDEICERHSLMPARVQGKGIRMQQMIVPFCEELGVYPIHFITFKNKTFCPECKKMEILASSNKLTKYMVNQEDKSKILKVTSKVLSESSVFDDETINKASFKTFKASDSKCSELLNNAVNIANQILEGSTDNFLFAGNTGTGKSHLAYSILDYVNKESYKKGSPKSCLFISIPKMVSLAWAIYQMDDAKSKQYKYTQNYFETLMGRTDVVVLDDLGAELGRITNDVKASDAKALFMNNLLSHRQGKTTIFTTNLTPKQVKSAYDDRADSRIKDGLEGNITVFEGTEDKRKFRK